jgi:hypothetical protein
VLVVLGLVTSMVALVDTESVAIQIGTLETLLHGGANQKGTTADTPADPATIASGCAIDGQCTIAEELATAAPIPVFEASTTGPVDSRTQTTAQPAEQPNATTAIAASPSESIPNATVDAPAPSMAATNSQVAQTPSAAAVSVVPTATLAATPQPTIEARRIVLDERFADNARGWPNNPQSTAWLADGGYQLFASESGKFVAIGVPSVPRLRNVTLTGSFRKVGGPPGGGYGLIVRDQEAGARDGLNQEGRYFVLEVGDRGEIGVWQRDGGRWIDRLPWTPSSIVRPGNLTNEVTVRTLGEHITFLVNGTEVTTQIDATLAEGYVGIFTGGDGNQAMLERLLVEATD